MQTWKMNWEILYLILFTVRIYATFELFPLRIFENVHQWSYVYHKLCLWKNVNFVFNLFNSTGIFIFIISSHSVALFVKWFVCFFFIIEFIGIKLYIAVVGWIVAPMILLPLCAYSLVMFSWLAQPYQLKSWRPTDIWETINDYSFKPPRCRMNYFTLVNQ